MAFEKKEFDFPSVSGLASIHAAKYIPQNCEVKAVLQIAHGMAEHFERYESFIDFLCANGVAVYTNDHLGHGKSVSAESEKGFFGEDGYMTLVDDCAKLADVAKDDYPTLPFVLFGHSMGSFIARAFALKYNSKLDGAVFCGTGGANPAAGMGIFIAKLIAAFHGGDHYRSKFIDNLAFGTYNKRCEGRTPFDWLSKDKDVVDKYIADPDCGYLFTINGFIGLFSALKSVSSKNWYNELPNSLPILLIAGAEDPVGSYGKGVQEVYDKLVASGKKDVNIILYENDRHEILNESDAFDKVCQDVLKFIVHVS